MSSFNPETDTNRLRDAAASALNRLALLNFQQKQLAKTFDFRPILDQIRRQRRIIDGIFILLAVILGYRIGAGFISGQLHYFSCVACGGFVYWFVSRQREVRCVKSVVDDYYLSLSEENAEASLLAAELRLHHPLTYRQCQLVNSGDVLTAAREVAEDRRCNGQEFIEGMWECHGIALIPALACAFREYRLAKRLDKMVADETKEESGRLSKNGSTLPPARVVRF